MTVRVIQLKKNGVRRVALVEEPHVRLLEDCSSVCSLAHEATECRHQAQREKRSLRISSYVVLNYGVE